MIENISELIDSLFESADLPKDKGNALAWAAKEGRAELLTLFLEAGADPNVKDGQGHTPLYYGTYNIRVYVCVCVCTESGSVLDVFCPYYYFYYYQSCNFSC